MALLHTADLHIGAFPNTLLYQAGISALEKIVEIALTEDVEAVLIAGDFLNRPRLSSVATLNEVVALLRRLRDEGVPVVAVRGSHDTSPHGSDHLTTFERAGLLKVTKYGFVADGSEMILYPLKVGEYIFYGIPGLKNAAELEYVRRGQVRLKDAPRDEGEVVVVLAHTHVRFAEYDPSDYERRYGRCERVESTALSSILPQSVKYVALGHIHYPLPLHDEFTGNIAYSGAPVGSSVQDLIETYNLRKAGKNRRVLLVDVLGSHPSIKSLWEGFGINVSYLEVSWPGKEALRREVVRKAKDMSGNFKVIVAKVTDVPPEKLTEAVAVEVEARALTRAFIKIITTTRHSADILVDVAAVLSGVNADIDEIEKCAVAEFLRKAGYDERHVTEFLRVFDALATDTEGTRDERGRRLLELLRRELSFLIH